MFLAVIKKQPKTKRKSISGILYPVSKVIVISLGQTSPSDSSNLPTRLGRAALLILSIVIGIFGLAARKVYPIVMSPRLCVSSYLTFSPLLLRAVIFCGTCCYPFRHLPVRKYGALCCPDFPHAESLLPATIAFRVQR